MDKYGAVELVMVEAERHFALPKGSLLRRSRRADIVKARSIAMYVVKRLDMGLTLSDIGHLFNYQTSSAHSMVLHSIKRVKQSLTKFTVAESLLTEVRHRIMEEQTKYLTKQDKNELIAAIILFMMTANSGNNFLQRS